MIFNQFSEFTDQAPIIRAALLGLSAVMAVLFCLTLAAFVVYLIGVWRLCNSDPPLQTSPPAIASPPEQWPPLDWPGPVPAQSAQPEPSSRRPGSRAVPGWPL